jgi:murein DD-endopeptidase MepM/ murein hydrolase activator NlpD
MANKETLVSGVNKLEAKIQGLVQQLTAANGVSSGGAGGTSTNFLSNALGSFSTTPSMRMMSRANLIGGVAQGAGKAIGGGFAMMPNVAATMERASSYYGATIRAGGGMGREAIQRMTMAGLGDGMTSPGSDAMVGAYLTQSNMFASANFGSTYQETVRSVSGAAKYLNMENTRAAAAVEGMTNRRGAGQMMRNFGILTADPTTGKEKTQGQILNEVYGRMTAGRGKVTEEQTLASLRRGALGRTLDSMNLTGDQRQMYEQFFVEKSRGNNMDLSDPEAMQGLLDKAAAEGNANPNLPGQKLNTSKTNAMQKAESQYIAGIEVATTGLIALTDAAGEAASALGGIKSGAGLFMGDPVGQGLGSVVSGAGLIGGGLGVIGAARKFAPGLLGSVGSTTANAPVRDPKTGRFVKAPVSTQSSNSKPMKFSPKGFGVGAVASIAGGVMGQAIAGDSEQGSGQSMLGNALSYGATGAGMGAMIGTFFGPGPGTAIGAAVGGGLGALYGAAVGGDDTVGNASAESGAPQAFKLVHPITPPKITATFGQKTSSFDKSKVVWPNGHKGVDYEAKMGQTVFAAASGTVVPTDSGGELGNYVKIKHDNGMYTFYAHLTSKTVTQGRVKAGQPVGGAGSTGTKSSGVHLHFALSTSESTANAINPAPYMSGTASSTGMVSGNAEQSGSGQSPSSMGDGSGRVEGASSEDTSAAAVAGATNILEITKTGYRAAGGQGPSSASDIEAWTAGSVYGTGAAGSSSNTGAQGGDGYTGEDKNDYLNGSKTILNKRGRSGNGGSGGDATNNVTINLTIGRATEDEARKFTRMLKAGLEDQKLMTNMARN